MLVLGPLQNVLDFKYLTSENIKSITFPTLWLSSRTLFFQNYPWFGFRFPDWIVIIYQIYPDFEIRNGLFSKTFSFLSFEIRSKNANKHIKQK